MNNKHKTRIVIVGGGAAGMELVAKLAKSSIKPDIDLALIDNKLKHIWKPLLHEVAVGTLSSLDHEVDYVSYASQHGFRFHYGYVEGLDRKDKFVIIKELVEEAEKPQRRIPYDILVFATGSISNDYGIPGLKQHCYFLDNLSEAETLNKVLLKKIIKILNSDLPEEKHFNIAIIGGGSTGVELAAELQYAFDEVSRIKKNVLPYTISVIESASRILPQLPERISQMAALYLEKIHIQLLTNKRIVEVTEKGLKTKADEFIPADMIIWSAGVQADPITKQYDGLEVNALNQLVVKDTLQTTEDPNIFALGDCASCPQVDKDGKMTFVPPRAAAAHQQVNVLEKSLENYIKDKPLLPFKYKDHGSLVTISKYNIVGSLMPIIAKNLYIEGRLARWTYWWLYKNHQIQLYGLWRVIVLTVANALASKFHPKLKLH